MYWISTRDVAQQISVQHPRVKTLYLFIHITYLRPKNMSYKSLLVTKIITYFKSQCAKKFVSNSLRLVDCAIGLVNTVLNWPAGQVKFFGEFKLQKNCIQSCSSNTFFRAVKETLGLVHARYSLPKWQAVKLTCFTPWVPLANPSSSKNESNPP